MSDKIKILKEKVKEIIVLFQRLSKEKRILGIVIILLIGFLLYDSLLAAQLLKLKAIGFQFVSEKRLLGFYNRLVKDVDTLVDEAEEREKKFSLLKENFLDEESLPSYFNQLRSQIKSHNLQVVSLDFKPQELAPSLNKKPLSYYKRLPFELALKGNYFNLMSLLYKLEESSPLLQMNSLRIKQESPDSYEVVINMKITIYILKNLI